MRAQAAESARKLRGGYYTDPEVAAWLLAWAMGGGAKRLLEPSCGDGVFLDAATRVESLREVVAFELDPLEAQSARERGPSFARVHAQDFLTWALARSEDPPDVDAAVGNPPFVRYQYLDEATQHRAEALSRLHALPFTRHTNLWVPFVLGALSRLRPGGRLAFVLPSELLHVLYAGPLRALLLARCDRVTIVDPEELFFEGTLQGTVLLLASLREAPGPAARVALVRTRGRAFLGRPPGELLAAADPVPGEALGAKWLGALLTAPEREVLAALADHPRVHPFGTLARSAVGIVTGANHFFLVDDSVVEAHGLAAYAHPMFGRSTDVPGVVFDAAIHAENRARGRPANFLWFKDTAREHLPPGVCTWLEEGERQALHRRFKCRIRSPWWAVPSVSAAPIALLKRAHDHPRLVLNRLGAFTTDTAYRVAPFGVAPERLVSAFVNALTALTAELEGRHYGGGVLELVPSEIARLLLPLPEAFTDVEALDAAVRGAEDTDTVLLDRTRRVFAAADLDPAHAEILATAWRRLRNRRQRRP